MDKRVYRHNTWMDGYIKARTDGREDRRTDGCIIYCILMLLNWVCYFNGI